MKAASSSYNKLSELSREMRMLILCNNVEKHINIMLIKKPKLNLSYKNS